MYKSLFTINLVLGAASGQVEMKELAQPSDGSNQSTIGKIKLSQLVNWIFGIFFEASYFD